MDWISFIQWPAMLVTVAASWLVSSTRTSKRGVAFWMFLASNLLWSIRGVHTGSYALVVLQLCLAVTNFRGAGRNDAA